MGIYGHPHHVRISPQRLSGLIPHKRNPWQLASGWNPRTITYAADAEEGETAADAEAALNQLALLVEQFGQEIINGTMAKGLSVEIARN